MINTIVLRDPQDLENLYPFSILHPSYEFFCGCLKNYERWKLLLPDVSFAYESDELRKSSFLERNKLANPEFDKNVLFIDG
ncbi:MAG TPA: putative sugar nucleotidyl transferase, partial [Candidatus Kapabacteria bacterium]|nr:putative sugar nucleotidyl transferase [Candidatus Kapabacteria bacterium]